MKTIEIENFITIRVLELNKEDYVCFVEDFNEKYFYIGNNNEVWTYQSDYAFYKLYFQKARVIHRDNLDKLKKDVYDLHRQLTFKIPRAEKGQEYYVISNEFIVRKNTELNDEYDKRYHKAYNYFLSESQARRFAIKMQEYLTELWKEEIENMD